MQAVIMAGGKGTRLASVLQDVPKPMVPFAGKPLLEYQIENLKDNGIEEIILVVGHLGEVITNHFGDGSEYGVHISYYVEKEPLGTAGALPYLMEQLEEDFILLFGDLFVNINFKRFYEFHQRNRACITLYAHPNSHPYDSDILVADKDNRVTEWSYKNSERDRDYKNLVNAGVYIISRKVIERLPVGQKVDLEKQFIVPMISEQIVYAYQCTEYVKDIGTPERLKKVEEDYRAGVCEKRNLKNRQKCIFLDRDGTINKHVGFLNDPKQMEIEEHAAEAIRLINESEYLAIVISNQPVIARGECSVETLEAIHNRMYMILGEDGAYVDDLYYCPHHPHSGYEGEVKELKIDCDCRKPRIGMIKQAVQDHNIDLQDSWMIGDTTMDIQTGLNAGIHTALVLTGEAGKDGKYEAKPDMVEENLLQCIKKILGGEN